MSITEDGVYLTLAKDTRHMGTAAGLLELTISSLKELNHH
jgi:hypothetical protein